jgi:flagellin-specific chaperone FliS
VLALYEKLGLGQLNEEAGLHLATVIRGLYDGAYQSLENINIRD